jgi:hypothetical protein
MPWHVIIFMNVKYFPVLRIIPHREGKNIPCYEFTFYTTYILAIKCSSRFKLHVFGKYNSNDVLVYKKIKCVFVCRVRMVILRRDWGRHIKQLKS